MIDMCQQRVDHLESIMLKIYLNKLGFNLNQVSDAWGLEQLFGSTGGLGLTVGGTVFAQLGEVLNVL